MTVPFPAQLVEGEGNQLNWEALGLQIGTPGAAIAQIPASPMVSQTRAFGTAYQPNTARPTFVMATLRGDSTGSAVQLDVRMDASNPPTTVIGEVRIDSGAIVVAFPVSFIVPAGFYYEFVKVTGTGGSNTLFSTFEMGL